MSIATTFSKINYCFNQWIGRFKWPVTLAVVLILVTVSLTTLFFEKRVVMLSGAQLVFEGRDFTYRPFSLMDAYDACVLETKARLGDSLLRQTMLPLSTRFDEKDKIFMVVLDADIGTVKEWTTAHVYCSIDPKKQRISYYKEVYDGQPNFLSRTMSSFVKLIK
jgi:hypothetical protein